MSYILSKSKSFLDTAESLKDSPNTIGIPHAAYYSCLLLSKYKLNNAGEIKYEDLATKEALAKTGSHEVIIREFAKYIRKSRSSSIDDRDYNNDIRALKALRENADYENKPIDEGTFKNCVNQAKELYNKINKIK
ncbi:MAG: hypothetical protein J6L20_01640 [Bacteroidales bacterium]|nr:hypothetical protein [Bacteroidales bacterium]